MNQLKKAYNSLLPKCIQHVFTVGNNILNVRTRQYLSFQVRYTKTTLKSQSVTIQGTKFGTHFQPRLKQIEVCVCL